MDPTMIVYPRIPEPPEPRHGAALLMYLIEHEITATLTDEDLEQADHAAVYAVAGHYDDIRVYARISAARHLIAGCLTARAKARQELAQLPQATPPDKPNVGPMATLTDALKTNPPAPAYAERPSYAERANSARDVRF